jgi:hypothetical protein
MVLPAGLHAQNVAITDDDGYTVDAAAMLDVKSINKGLLVPRVALVSTTDPVSVTKPDGLLVWNTSTSGSYSDPGFYYWSGSDWVKVGSSALDFGNGLTQSGNSVKLGGALTESSTITQGAYSMNFNLSGTGDFNIQDEGTSAFFVKEDGNVGIGTITPEHKLELNGNLKLGDNIMLEGYSNYRVYRNLVSYGASTTTGAVVINTNQPMNSACMFRVKIEGYLYNSSGPLEIIIGAYTNSNGFHNRGHLNIGSEKLEVRLAQNTSTNKIAIILGDIETSFSHPKFTVTEFYQGHNGRDEIFADGWTITQVTDLSGYDHIENVPDRTNMDNRYYTESEIDNLISGENLWDRTSTITYLHNSGDKVGIGLSNPPRKLSVLGDALFTNDIFLRDGATTGDYLVRIYDSSDDGALAIYRNNVVKIRLHGNNNSYFTGGNVGFGTTSPGSRLEVYGNESGSDNDPLFEVKNNEGQTIFAVYPEGVRIYVDEDVSKGLKGGFAVGGFNASKGITNEYLRITPDTFRIYVDDTGTKGLKGGFAVGGYGSSKGLTNEYFRVTPDSVRIYVDNVPVGTKGLKGGFAVGGFNASKGYEDAISFMNITPENYFIGHESGLKTNPSTGDYGKYNNFFGYQAGKENFSGHSNTFIGREAGNKNSGGYENVFIGNQAGLNTVTGYDNVYIGNSCGAAGHGQYNVYIGHEAGKSNNGGSLNVFIGKSAGEAVVNSDYNVFMGCEAGATHLSGDYNTFIGEGAGYNNVSGDHNVLIGYRAGYNETESDKLYIETSSSSNPLIYGDFSTNDVRINGDICWTGSSGSCSDVRYKRDINIIHGALEKINKINGVYYYWRTKEFSDMEFSEERQVGIIAQEIEKLFPELVNTDASGYKSVNYSKITTVLIEAVKEQQQTIEELENEIEKINDLQNQIDRLRNSFELNKQ